MKKTFVAVCTAILVFSGAARASGPIAAYALIDKVILEPQGEAAQRIQIWGTFAMLKIDQDGNWNYLQPARGYMYFSIVPGQERQCRAEWADLEKSAGTGQIVGFGQHRGRFNEQSYRLRKPQVPSAPSGPIDKKRVQQLIDELNSDDFVIREKASKELGKLGDAAKPALKEALKKESKPEVRRRLEALLPAEAATIYPVGLGLYKIRKDTGFQPVNELKSLPGLLSPIENDQPAAGPVTLAVRNVVDETYKGAKYVFEIEGPAGAKEKSPEVSAGQKETKWSPSLKVKPGEKYTWSVRAVDGSWKSPVVSAAFRAKSTR